MPTKREVLDVTPQERALLEQLWRCGHAGTRNLMRARLGLKAEEGLTDETRCRCGAAPGHPSAVTRGRAASRLAA
jgi:hypothetical protein